MTSRDKRGLQTFWRETRTLIDRQIAATEVMRDWANDIPGPTDNEPPFTRAMATYLGSPAGAPLAKALSPTNGHASGHSPSGEYRIVDISNNLVKAAVRSLQREMLERLEQLPGSPHHAALRELLRLPPEALAARFDSATLAWDELVALKFRMHLPDHRFGRYDSWFTSVVSSSERFIRDVIGVTVVNVGRELLSEELEACFDTDGVQFFHPSPRQIVRSKGVDEVLVECALNYMNQGITPTTVFAEQFTAALGLPMFQAEAKGLRPGLLSSFPFLQGSTTDVWWTIVGMRREIVHETADLLVTESAAAERTSLYGLDVPQLGLLADLLCALTVGFASQILYRVTERAQDQDLHSGALNELQYRAGGELRVTLMHLLRQQRNGLVWALAEMGKEQEPDTTKGMMLTLNSFLARKRLDPQFFSPDELSRLEVGSAPRFRLLKSVILGHLEREQLVPVLNEALETEDLSLHEIDSWPGLHDLRHIDWWRPWRDAQQHGSTKNRSASR